MKRKARRFSTYQSNKNALKNRKIKINLINRGEKINVKLDSHNYIITNKLCEELQCSKSELFMKALHLLHKNYVDTKYPSLRNKHKKDLYKVTSLDEREIKEFINRDKTSIPLELLL